MPPDAIPVRLATGHSVKLRLKLGPSLKLHSQHQALPYQIHEAAAGNSRQTFQSVITVEMYVVFLVGA